MKIVKFEDGTYGIKDGWLFVAFYDMSGNFNNWWTDEEHIQRNGKTHDLERCKSIFNRLKNEQQPNLKHKDYYE